METNSIRALRVKCIGAYMEPKAALAELQANPAKVILMDIRMPGMSGIECTHELRTVLPCSTSRIIMFTALVDAYALFESFRAGADGYLTKGSGTRFLPEAIFYAVKGGIPISPEMKGRLINFSRPAGGEGLPKLSQREWEVLDLICHGLADKTIASRLALSANTIKGTKRSLFAK